ncbi:PaaI family thioesterase [Pseudomonas sp. NPDC090755]|uniref:PaaI family thioesterase n=1 Tax=Pseudomonas sp. NPDC090755 TaxID=3364481 RepID=UPI00383B2990
MSANSPMEGFEVFPTRPGFIRHNGGIFLHCERPVIGMHIAEEHLNPLRIAHGGYLATLADTAFGAVLRRQYDLPVAPVTVNLSVDYLAAVREGDWVEVEVKVHKFGRTFISASCELKVGERLAVRANGIFTVWTGAIPAIA